MNTLKNRVQLIGSIGREPEIREFGEGRKMARFALTTEETEEQSGGETITRTSWHNLVAWGPAASLISKRVAKGDRLAVEGRLVNRSFVDKEGLKRTSTEVEVLDVLVLNNRRKPEYQAPF
jgi:single-strand DNA-binding protein